MIWILRVVVGVALLFLGLAAVFWMTALRSERPVGFDVVQAATADGKPFLVAIWYPTEARPLPTSLVGPVLMDVARSGAVAGKAMPLVVISHGNGGGPAGHADLAMDLASAGYVVAAPMHSGDNFADQSGVASGAFFNGRTQELRATVDYMLGKWQARERIDAARIGAFGFSMGGFTVLTAVGAQPELGKIATHCASAKEFVCDVLRHFKSPQLDAGTPAAKAFEPDLRVKAAVLAAPGLGFTMRADQLATVRVPVQLWSADHDDKVGMATEVREAFGEKLDFNPVPGASHLSFLSPCSIHGILAPEGVCSDQGRFDRKDFHKKMNASVIAFFDKNMKPS
jgi:predicted dienelactone hydrolase